MQEHIEMTNTKQIDGWPDDYPSWSPPEYVVGKDHGSWSIAIAKRHYEWFMGAMDKRINIIEEYLGRRIESEVSYKSSAEDVYNLVSSSSKKFSSKFDHLGRLNQERVPCDKGNAVLADLGLALANSIITESSKPVCWRLSQTRGKKINANLPVLVPSLDAAEHREMNPSRLCVACGWDALREADPGQIKVLWDDLAPKFL